MLKSDLIERISQKQTHLTMRDVALAVNTILDTMTHALGTTQRIEVRGFGSFSLHYRAARQAHNPKTGAKLMTEPKYAVHFKVGKEMRDRINASRHIPIKEIKDIPEVLEEK